MSPSAVQRLMSTIVHPILQVLYTSPLETVMADQLVKPVLSIVNTLRQISALSTIENQSLLSALIRYVYVYIYICIYIYVYISIFH
jgi:hypothetical protein